MPHHYNVINGDILLRNFAFVSRTVICKSAAAEINAFCSLSWCKSVKIQEKCNHFVPINSETIAKTLKQPPVDTLTFSEKLTKNNFFDSRHDFRKKYYFFNFFSGNCWSFFGHICAISPKTKTTEHFVK